MKKSIRGVCGAVVGLLCFAMPVLAHHSVSAEFDTSKSFTVKATFTKLEWVNPHVYFYADVKNDDGTVTPYSFEAGPPGGLRRSGVVKPMFSVGDQVTIEAWVAKDGSKHLGLMKAVHFADGHSIVFGTPSDSEGKNE
jgi:Family of unknown function (DUF6152)